MKRSIAHIAAGLLVVGTIGCGSGTKKDKDFYTSGNRDADQRAEQRIATDQQIKHDSGQKNVKTSLYERLGGEKGIAMIVDDFVSRAMADPRVNFERKGITRGGVMGVGGSSAEWNPTPANVEQMKKHFAQFLSVATGGPAHYDGLAMAEAHKGMQITNAEFDASVGDLKATLDKLQVPIAEQKELIAIVESTRPQIAEQR